MSVASKNVFAALGSDDEESDPRPVAKSTTSKTEPKAGDAAPATRGTRGSGERGARGSERGTRGARGGRGRGGSSRGGYSNEDAFKDRDNVLANRERETDPSAPRSRGRGRGGRGGREYDRHSATGRVDTQKATNQGWGNEATSWESAEPLAEADRNEEKKDAEEPTTAPEGTVVEETTKEPEREPEEADNTMTYDEYLASQKKLNVSNTDIRKPDQSQWEGTTSLLKSKARALEDTFFGESSAQKTKSSSTSTKKSAPKKVVLEIEQRFTPIRSGRGGDRGGRGGYRGTGDRAERGDRPERGERSDRGSGRGRGDSDRPRGRGRGDDRGGRGRGASTRGGRGGAQTIDVADTKAFPALG